MSSRSNPTSSASSKWIDWRRSDLTVLIPEAARRRAAEEVASPERWRDPGQSGDLLWGEYAGSGAVPYRVRVDLTATGDGPGLVDCSCPSRQRPCKHGLGLIILARAGLVSPGGAPPAPVEWVRAARPRRGQGRRGPEAGHLPLGDQPDSSPKPDPARSEGRKPGRDKRDKANDDQVRERRVLAGLDELERWLGDLLGGGLAALGARSGAAEEWARMAGRLDDAQAPGLARRLRHAARLLPGTGENWIPAMLEELGVLFLLSTGYRARAGLTEQERADLRTRIGWPQRREEAVATAPVADDWLVVGRHQEPEKGRVSPATALTIERTWLLGRQTARPALLIDYDREATAPDLLAQSGNTASPGMVVSGDLYFFPSGWPLRGILEKSTGESRDAIAPAGWRPAASGVKAALVQYATALAGNPWLEVWPLVLGGVVPARRDGRWLLVDRAGEALPLAGAQSDRTGQPDRPDRTDRAAWSLLALGGGAPLDIFGEWDGDEFRPLTVLGEGEWWEISATGTVPAGFNDGSGGR